MMLASYSLASRPMVAAPLATRPFALTVLEGEYGWAAWSYSRQAKLNAWAWHGMGDFGGARINSWASLGNAVYLRRESDSSLLVMKPDTFYGAAEENTESESVEAVTQWLDFGKPGKMKALTGLDFDGANITAVEVYVSVGGGRSGELAESVAVNDNQGGWTYSGEMIPLSCAGTEFKIRFVGDGNLECQVNKLTLHYEEISG